MTARFIVGDTRAVTATLPDGSVDFIMSSPPYGIRLDGYHTGTGWRPGIVLDPFAGTGTTLAVATGHGRDAIGIDLDPRNADLAIERVGPLLLTVEHHELAA